MKYTINEDMVEPFEVSNVEVEEADDDRRVRRWITASLLTILSTLILGGLVLSFKSNDSDIFKSLLNAVTPFIAIAIGYYFGTQKRK